MRQVQEVLLMAAEILIGISLLALVIAIVLTIWLIQKYDPMLKTTEQEETFNQRCYDIPCVDKQAQQLESRIQALEKRLNITQVQP